MIDLKKYGFEEITPNNQWSKDGDVIYAGLGEDENGGFSVQLLTLCNEGDIGISSEIIFRGTYYEMDIYLKTIHRKEKLNEILNVEILKK